MRWFMTLVVALAAGFAGAATAQAGGVRLVPRLAERVPAGRHVAYIAVLWAHLASYASAALGTIVLCLHTAWRRYRRVS